MNLYYKYKGFFRVEEYKIMEYFRINLINLTIKQNILNQILILPCFCCGQILILIIIWSFLVTWYNHWFHCSISFISTCWNLFISLFIDHSIIINCVLLLNFTFYINSKDQRQNWLTQCISIKRFDGLGNVQKSSLQDLILDM